MKKSASYFLGESLLIIFSILLALSGNEWRERYNEGQALKSSVSDLSIEIRDNLALLEGIPDYHRMIAHSLRQSIEAMEENGDSASKMPIELLMAQENLRPTMLGFSTSLQSGSWQMAKDRGIVERLDYDTAKLLFVTYDQQLSSVNEQMFELADRFTEPEMYSRRDQEAILAALSATFMELASREENLIYLLEKNLERLQQQYPKATKASAMDRD